MFFFFLGFLTTVGAPVVAEADPAPDAAAAVVDAFFPPSVTPVLVVLAETGCGWEAGVGPGVVVGVVDEAKTLGMRGMLLGRFDEVDDEDAL